eukprot:9614168-Prorocentrum_lima.AAC.1
MAAPSVEAPRSNTELDHDLNADLFAAIAVYMGFQLESQPHLKVAEHIDATYQYYAWWYRAQWDG